MTILLHDTAKGLSLLDRAYATKKLEKLAKFMPEISVVELHHGVDRLDHKSDIWIRGGGHVIRVSSRHAAIRASLDLAIQKAAERLRRVHAKVRGRSSRRSNP